MNSIIGIIILSILRNLQIKEVTVFTFRIIKIIICNIKNNILLLLY